MRWLALLLYAACSSSTIYPDVPRTADAAPPDAAHADAPPAKPAMPAAN